MSLRVFVAGATGAVGRPLVVQLAARGYAVFGTTRSIERGQELERAGVRPVVVDALDREAVARAVQVTQPDVIIHQLTDLSGGFAPDRVAHTLARNSRLRVEGTRNLVDAARAFGVRRLVAQSIAWVYAPGREPHVETDPLDTRAEGTLAITMRGVIALEDAVLHASPVEGVVLRYGWFYGPGANEKPAGTPGVHVAAAARAAVLAATRGAPGVYNVAEPSAVVSIEKARRELGWTPDPDDDPPTAR